MAKIDTFVDNMILATLLRDYYSNDILYLGRDTDLKKLAKACGKFSPDYEAACKKFITCTTLQYALNAPYNQSDVRKLKLLAHPAEHSKANRVDPVEKMQFDAVEMAERLYRYGRIVYSDEEKALLYAFLNSPVSDTMYKRQEGLTKECRENEIGLPYIRKRQDELAKRQAAGATSAELNRLQDQIQASKRALAAGNVLYDCDNPITTYTKPDGTVVYTATIGEYCHKYYVPPKDEKKGTGKDAAEGKHKDILCVEKVSDPAIRKSRVVGGDLGPDLPSIEKVVNKLPAIQANSDKVNPDDFGALMGFRLEPVSAAEIFPSATLPSGLVDGRMFRIVPTHRQMNLSLILTAYLPYLSVQEKRALEDQMSLSRGQMKTYLDILDTDGAEAATGSDLTGELDAALEACRATKLHYMPESKFKGLSATNLINIITPPPKDPKTGKKKPKPVPPIPPAPVKPGTSVQSNFWYEFGYTKWDWVDSVDGKKELRLVPLTDASGQPRTIQMLPFQIVSSEGRIYLVGLRLDMSNAQNYDEDKGQWVLSNLRVDRIRDLHQVSADDPANTLRGEGKRKDWLEKYYDEIFYTARELMGYRNTSPRMFSGTPKNWLLDCSPEIPNVLAETFGANAVEFCEQVPAPAPLNRGTGTDKAAAPRPDWSRVQVEACWYGIRLFLLQNLDNVQLADVPEQAAARAEMRDLLFNAGANYDVQ